MDEPTVIARIADEVERKLGGESSGHDWWHIHRVWKMAEHIANNTSANPLVVQLAALLHDIVTGNSMMAMRRLVRMSPGHCSFDTACQTRSLTPCAPLFPKSASRGRPSRANLQRSKERSSRTPIASTPSELSGSLAHLPTADMRVAQCMIPIPLP